jgi:hypothetical protein
LCRTGIIPLPQSHIVPGVTVQLFKLGFATSHFMGLPYTITPMRTKNRGINVWISSLGATKLGYASKSSLLRRGRINVWISIGG